MEEQRNIPTRKPDKPNRWRTAHVGRDVSLIERTESYGIWERHHILGLRALKVPRQSSFVFLVEVLFREGGFYYENELYYLRSEF
jgi:hypothetical protein